MTIYNLDIPLSQFWIVHCSMSDSNCCFLICIQASQEECKMVWYFHLLKNFPQFVVIHTVKGFSIVNEAEVDVFLEFPCFFYDPTDVGNLISCSSVFSNPACTSGHSLFMYFEAKHEGFWALPCQHVNWAQLHSYFNSLWHFLSFGLEWKLTFFSPVAIAEFSKFAGILREAL